jgi:hypothetical protein
MPPMPVIPPFSEGASDPRGQCSLPIFSIFRRSNAESSSASNATRLADVPRRILRLFRELLRASGYSDLHCADGSRIDSVTYSEQSVMTHTNVLTVFLLSARCRRFARSIMDALMRMVLIAWFITAASGAAGASRSAGGAMSDLYVFQPIARPALWTFSSNPQPPPGYITLAATALRRRREHPGRTELLALADSDEAAARSDLAQLIALFGVLPPAERVHFLELAQQVLEADSPGGHSSG